MRLPSQQRFGLHRWHIPDPVRFQSDSRVTIQALGWLPGARTENIFRCKSTSLPSRSGSRRYRPPFPELPGPDYLEIA
nr:DUF2961 domain-containing protein [Bradyrhizobium sp. CCBAU 45321]